MFRKIFKNDLKQVVPTFLLFRITRYSRFCENDLFFQKCFIYVKQGFLKDTKIEKFSDFFKWTVPQCSKSSLMFFSCWGFCTAMYMNPLFRDNLYFAIFCVFIFIFPISLLKYTISKGLKEQQNTQIFHDK